MQFTTSSEPVGLMQTAAANVETGVLMLCKEMLVTAITDRRLDRKHLVVLAAFVQVINLTTARAWPSRGTIASLTGYSEKTVSNIISELRGFAYLVSDRTPIEEAGGRTLTAYTFGKIDHATIRAEITKAVEQIQAERRDKMRHLTSPPTGNPLPRPQGTNFPAGGEPTSPQVGNFPARREPTSPSVGNCEFPAHREVPRPQGTNEPTSLPAGNTVPRRQGAVTYATVEGLTRCNESNGEESVNPRNESKNERESGASLKSTKPATRLPDDWKLPKSWGDWTLEHYGVAAQTVREQAAKFRDYWTSKGGGATKRDWERTWRNWIRTEAAERKWPTLKPETDAAPDLLDIVDEPEHVRLAREIAERDRKAQAEYMRELTGG